MEPLVAVMTTFEVPVGPLFPPPPLLELPLHPAANRSPRATAANTAEDFLFSRR